MKMFNLIDIGEHAGSGVPNIYNVWEDEGWEEPVIEESFDPDRTSLVLKFVEKQAIKTSDKKQAIKADGAESLGESGGNNGRNTETDTKTSAKTDTKTSAKTDAKTSAKTSDKKQAIKTSDKNKR